MWILFQFSIPLVPSTGALKMRGRTRRDALLAWIDRIALATVCAIAVIMWPGPAAARAQGKRATEYPESNVPGVGLATFGRLLSSSRHGCVATSNALDNQLKISSG